MASPKTTESKPDESEKEKARKRRQYVSPHPDGGWQVKPEGATKATKRFKTKAEAEEFAKDLAKRQGVGMVRQKKDGKIQKKR
ncbi:MAG: DUF2188 domain-containing protein [Thermoplasmatales archaeon]|nr:DUF2188 domain-containing protein [Thermoplasmatales archaeon]